MCAATTGDGRALGVDARKLRATLAGSNVTVLTSSSGEETSREDETWRNGAFTEVLIEALGRPGDTNGNGMISVEELTGYVGHHVAALTGGKQIPEVEMRFRGDLFLSGL